jgi:hypothetical protein
MGGAKQLFRVGALAVAHARAGVVLAIKCAASQPHVTGALSRISTPFASAVLFVITSSIEID